MAGIIFAISILSILTTVGFLFAWMVRLASVPEVDAQNNEPVVGDLAPSTIRTNRH